MAKKHKHLNEVRVAPPKKVWRAVDIHAPIQSIKEIGFLTWFWGTDIFINDVPLLKCMVVANVVVWILVYFVK